MSTSYTLCNMALFKHYEILYYENDNILSIALSSGSSGSSGIVLVCWAPGVLLPKMFL